MRRRLPPERKHLRSIGEVLTAVRQWRKLTQKQLAERADLPQSSISLLERGLKEPSLAIFDKLGAALGVDSTLILWLGYHYQDWVKK
jgi:transcriptional regulator with XRE-family HTH domain